MVSLCLEEGNTGRKLISSGAGNLPQQDPNAALRVGNSVESIEGPTAPSKPRYMWRVSNWRDYACSGLVITHWP